MSWHPNTGQQPERAVAGNKVLQISRVAVRLRNGMTPPETWPVDTGRHQTTRWSLQGHPFDIVEWREV